MSLMKEFKEFAVKGNAIDMAVGIIIGGAFGKIVTSLVSDVIMPPLGRILGAVDFRNLFINLSAQPYATLADAQKAGAPTLNYGNFIQTVVDFLIVAFVIFTMIRAMNKVRKPEVAAAPATPEDVLLLREIRDSLKK